MNIIKYGILLLGFVLSLIFSPVALAQDNTETERIDALKEMLKSESFNLSSLIYTKAVFDFADNGTRSFSVPHARLKANGRLDGGFSYKIHFDVADGFVLTDAEITYAINNQMDFTAGAQKPGISYEFLTAPHKLDFVSRSFIVTELTQNRDMGIRLHGDLADKFNYSIGVFNGNGLSSNANNKFNYAGRLGYSSSNDSGSLIAGVNASYGEHNGSNIGSGGGWLPGIDGERFIYGGDVRYESSSLILASEVLAADLEYTGFTEQDKVFGFHVTCGFKFSSKSRVLARYDHIESKELPLFDREQLVLGFTHFPTSQTGFRVNYLLPLDNSELKYHGLALNYQISF